MICYVAAGLVFVVLLFLFFVIGRLDEEKKEVISRHIELLHLIQDGDATKIKEHMEKYNF